MLHNFSTKRIKIPEKNKICSGRVKARGVLKEEKIDWGKGGLGVLERLLLIKVTRVGVKSPRADVTSAALLSLCCQFSFASIRVVGRFFAPLCSPPRPP